MTAKKTTVEKEIKSAEVKAAEKTPKKATTTKKAPAKKLSKEELMEKVVEEVNEVDISAEKEQELFDEAEKPAETTKKPEKRKKVAITKKVPTKAKTPVFPDVFNIENIGTLKKVTSEDYQELKAMDNLVFVTAWTKKSVKYYDDSHTPGVKTSDLYTLGNWSYDVQTPIFFKENSEQVVTISNFTEACFIFGHANCFDILEDENGEGNFRNDYDLLFEIYQLVEAEEQ